MDARIEKLNAKIEKLLQEKQKIEEGCVQALAQIVSDTVKKGTDIQVLAGLLLDVTEILQSSLTKLEAWQVAGEKFLSKAKHRDTASSKTEATSHSIQSAIETTFDS